MVGWRGSRREKMALIVASQPNSEFLRLAAASVGQYLLELGMPRLGAGRLRLARQSLQQRCPTGEQV